MSFKDCRYWCCYCCSKGLSKKNIFIGSFFTKMSLFFPSYQLLFFDGINSNIEKWRLLNIMTNMGLVEVVTLFLSFEKKYIFLFLIYSLGTLLRLLIESQPSKKKFQPKCSYLLKFVSHKETCLVERS